MKIKDVLGKVDDLKPNDYATDTKISWLSHVDSTINEEIVKKHDNPQNITFNGYDSETDPETELIAVSPFDEMYTRFLMAQIDLNNGEYNGYNANISVFNSLMSSYTNWYNRNFTPLGEEYIKYHY